MRRLNFNLNCSVRIFLLALILMISLICNYKLSQAATNGEISFSTTVLPVLSLTVSESDYSFGNLTAGTPKYGSSGIELITDTNSANGYSLSITDSMNGTNSALLHSDLLTYIPDYASLISSPSIWQVGDSKGLGFTVYWAETAKEAKWGSGAAYNDINNKYAGVPAVPTSFHTAPGYKNRTDMTKIAFALDVFPDQKTGSYEGIVTITATALLE